MARLLIVWATIMLPAWLGLIDPQPSFVAFLDKWQTLLGGCVAVIAAVIGGSYVLRQIDTADRHERERLHRLYDAERALLPMTLSSLSAYARKSSEALRNLIGQCHGEQLPGTAAIPELPAPPAEAVKQLRDLIESTERSNLRQRFSRVLNRLQVQSARMLDLGGYPARAGVLTVTRANLEQYLLDAAEIYALAASMFEFARRECDEVPSQITPANMSSALNQIDARDFDYPRVHERLQSWKERW